MKVNGTDGYSAIRSLLQKPQGSDDPQRLASPERRPLARGEKVVISTQAREIQNLKAILNGIPDVREKKVEEIRKLIEEGQYRVNLGEVADSILQALILGDL